MRTTGQICALARVGTSRSGEAVAIVIRRVELVTGVVELKLVVAIVEGTINDEASVLLAFFATIVAKLRVEQVLVEALVETAERKRMNIEENVGLDEERRQRTRDRETSIKK